MCTIAQKLFCIYSYIMMYFKNALKVYLSITFKSNNRTNAKDFILRHFCSRIFWEILVIIILEKNIQTKYFNLIVFLRGLILNGLIFFHQIFCI